MSSTEYKDAVESVEACRQLFDSAVTEKDEEALRIKDLASVQTSASNGSADDQAMREFLGWAVQKTLSVVAGAVTGGVGSIAADNVIGLLGQVVNPGEDPNKMFKGFDETLDKLVEEQQDSKRHTTRRSKIETIEQLSNTVQTFWKLITNAIKFDDKQQLFRQIKQIGNGTLDTQLTAMRNALQKSEPDFNNETPAVNLQKLYRRRLESTTTYFNYDVVQYIQDTRYWYNLTTSVDRQATALLILLHQCRNIETGVREAQQNACRQESEVFRKAMESAFLGDLAWWPVSHELVKAATRGKDDDFFYTFVLRNGNGQQMYLKRVTYTPYGSNGALSDTQTFFRFEPVDGRQGSPLTTRAFAFERENDVWYIRGNAVGADQRKGDCVPFARWDRLRSTSDGLYVSSGASDARFKIIPLWHPSEWRVKIVVIRDDGKEAQSVIDSIVLEYSNFWYPMFGDQPAAEHSVFRRFIDGHGGVESFYCYVNNFSSKCVLVLDDASGVQGTYHYANTVWLPGDNYCVGAWGTDAEAYFRFAYYEIQDVSADKEAIRERVRHIHGLNPRTGRVGLRAEGARLLKYIWLRCKVPKFGKNTISARAFELDYQHNNLQGLNPSGELVGALNEYETTTDARKSTSSSSVPMETFIGGGFTVWAELKVW